MKSDCQHEWIKGRPPACTEICMWCGLPKVRTSAPRPVTKCPPRVKEAYWLDRKARGLTK